MLHTLDVVTYEAVDDQAARRERVEKDVRATLGKALEGRATGVDVQVLHGWPAENLLEAARTSDLLVLGRHDPRVPFGSHLGPVVRAVIREAPCPVMLVDLHGTVVGRA